MKRSLVLYLVTLIVLLGLSLAGSNQPGAPSGAAGHRHRAGHGLTGGLSPGQRAGRRAREGRPCVIFRRGLSLGVQRGIKPLLERL